MQFFNPNTAPQYATPERMKQVWQVQLDLTRKFKEVCQRHGLQFWMDSGTILGAVRHQGYIPWDDDIDLAMPRADYDKLNKIAAQEFTHPYFWQTTYSDRNFFCGHAILRNAETAEFNQSEMDKGYCLGIGVDVFVIDGVVSNPVGYALHRAAAKMLNKWTRSLIAHSCSWLSYKTVFRWYERLFALVDLKKSKKIGHICWRYRHHEVFERAYYDETVWLDFAGIQLPAPARYHEFLSYYYGSDYMTPKQDPSYHGQKYYDTERAYPEAIALVKQQPALFEERVRELYSSQS